MAKYLIQSAIEIIKADGVKVFIEQTLRYLTLYGSPIRVGRYWLNKIRGIDEIVVEVQGSLMQLSLKDRGIHADLFINRIREPQATRHMQAIMEPEWVVVDIGANIGYYALMEARVVEKVIAVEPGPDNYRNLANNVRINGYDNVEVRQLAMGDHEGSIGFHIAKACNWNRIASGNDSVDVEVPMVTLDKFLDGSQVDFVRMDVEGYEGCILKGMSHTLRHSKPDMFIELHRDLLCDYGSSQLEFMETLSGYGYSISKSYISAREGPTGKIKDLLRDPITRRMITERGIASHMFFSVDNQCVVIL